jgi:hypothetical protein
MGFELLFGPAEAVDAWLTGFLHGAPLPLALAVAAALGLRHASDPDHLVAVTSLATGRTSGAVAGARLGAFWGIGHAAILLALGVPLILARGELPTWLEQGAERLVGLVILLLAIRLVHRHLRPAARHERAARTPAGAVAVGMLHGLAGTGAVVVLLIAALPGTAGAVVALALFASLSAVSMAGCSAAWSWLLTRPVMEPAYGTVVVPGLALFSSVFGLAYMGLF